MTLQFLCQCNSLIRIVNELQVLGKNVCWCSMSMKLHNHLFHRQCCFQLLASQPTLYKKCTVSNQMGINTNTKMYYAHRHT